MRQTPSTANHANVVASWRELTAQNGRKYYYNSVTKVSVWEMPQEYKGTIIIIGEDCINYCAQIISRHRRDKSIRCSLIGPRQKRSSLPCSVSTALTRSAAGRRPCEGSLMIQTTRYCQPWLTARLPFSDTERFKGSLKGYN